jgi:hypothetical protein
MQHVNRMKKYGTLLSTTIDYYGYLLSLAAMLRVVTKVVINARGSLHKLSFLVLPSSTCLFTVGAEGFCDFI